MCVCVCERVRNRERESVLFTHPLSSSALLSVVGLLSGGTCQSQLAGLVFRQESKKLCHVLSCLWKGSWCGGRLWGCGGKCSLLFQSESHWRFLRALESLHQTVKLVSRLETELNLRTGFLLKLLKTLICTCQQGVKGERVLTFPGLIVWPHFQGFCLSV